MPISLLFSIPKALTFWVVMVKYKKSHITCDLWVNVFRVTKPILNLKTAQGLLWSNEDRKFVFSSLSTFPPDQVTQWCIYILKNWTIYHCTVTTLVTHSVHYEVFWPWVVIRNSFTCRFAVLLFINLVLLHILTLWSLALVFR